LRQVEFEEFVGTVLIGKRATPGEQGRAKHNCKNTFQDHVTPPETIKLLPVFFPGYASI
jgi:hypothetical protein